MGTIVQTQTLNAKYAVYYDGSDNLVLVEDLKGVENRVVTEAKPLPTQPGSACEQGCHAVEFNGRQYCVPD